MTSAVAWFNWFFQAADADWIRQLGSMGVGGLLAGGMFALYRQDRKDSSERFRAFTEMHDRQYAELAKDYRLIVENNTAALVRLLERNGCAAAQQTPSRGLL